MGALLTIALGLFGVNHAYAQDTANELAAIKTVESSNGQNINHRLMTTGLHKGTRAGGYYGIMPITAREAIENNPKTFANYQYLLNLTNDEITEELNTNRTLDKKLAMFLWNRLRQKFSASGAACAWFWGEHSKRCQDKKVVRTLDYVEKFNMALNN